MPRKPTRKELEASLLQWEKLALLSSWALRQEACLPASSFVVIQRPRSGPIVAQTDEHGSLTGWTIEPLDSNEVSHAYRVTENDEYQRGALIEALLDAKLLQSFGKPV
jgi:hypothetical protein